MSTNNYVEPTILKAEGVDGYNARGLKVSRDACMLIVASLMRDAHELETRGGEANRMAALEIRVLHSRIVSILNEN